MTVSFKQFSSIVDTDATEQLDEIWSKIIGKKKEEESADDKKSFSKVMTAKERLAKKKEQEEARKKELQKKRDDAWAAAKDRTERGGSNRSYDRDDYAQHRSAVREGKESYSDHGYWKDDAAEQGFKVKKVSGNLENGDQTWQAFDEKGNKVGEFTEKEDGRGGWLRTA